MSQSLLLRCSSSILIYQRVATLLTISIQPLPTTSHTSVKWLGRSHLSTPQNLKRFAGRGALSLCRNVQNRKVSSIKRNSASLHLNLFLLVAARAEKRAQHDQHVNKQKRKALAEARDSEARNESDDESDDAMEQGSRKRRKFNDSLLSKHSITCDSLYFKLTPVTLSATV